MNLFADASALAKCYIADETSDDFDALLLRATSLSASVLCVPEIILALCRRRQERTLTQAQYAAAKGALESDLANATVIQNHRWSPVSLRPTFGNEPASLFGCSADRQCFGVALGYFCVGRCQAMCGCQNFRALRHQALVL